MGPPKSLHHSANAHCGQGVLQLLVGAYKAYVNERASRKGGEKGNEKKKLRSSARADILMSCSAANSKD